MLGFAMCYVPHLTHEAHAGICVLSVLSAPKPSGDPETANMHCF
jgi:hypothetical protein